MQKMLFKKLIAIVALSFFFLTASAQDCGPINLGKVKELLTGLGFSPRPSTDTGKVIKYIIDNKGNSFNIPTSFEISASTNYIWLSVNLGEAPSDSCETNTLLLKKNASVQPAFFYISSLRKLMMSIAIENRAVTAAVIKRCNDFIVKQVEATKDLWQQ
jgi:hypothetical protein